MADVQNEPLLQMETTCGTLLYELQIIWDELGESEKERDKMLLELEQECLEVYRRRVDHANRCRAQLRQAIADSEAELAAICSAMGERPVHIRHNEQKVGSLKELLNTILPQVDEMRIKKSERKNQFLEVIGQIQKVSAEIYGSSSCSKAVVDENDISLRRLEELQTQLQSLRKQKSDRLRQVMEDLSLLSSSCSVLGMDFKETVQELHPSLAGSQETHSISSETLQLLESAIKRLRELKTQRMKRLQDLATMLLELWNLTDTPLEEQQAFNHVTCNIAASEDEISQPNMLSVDVIKYVELEVSRLEELKSSKMKELVLKKRTELEEICRKTHLIPNADGVTEHIMEAIDSGALDPACILEQMEMEVSKVREEAFSRKEILEKVEKWLSASEEEEWLEEYNMDENRYNAGRGAHLILKRAEKARTLVNKLPGMVEVLAAKVLNWENERGVEFMYDGTRLISMLEEYILLRQEKEQDKKQQREQKKLEGHLIAEQEALFGSKPSLLKTASRRVSMGGGGNNNRSLSLGGNVRQTPRPVSSHSSKATPNSRLTRKDDNPGPLTGTARRGLDIGNLPVKNLSLRSREYEATPSRRPFSPISSTASLRTNADTFDDQNIPQNNNKQKEQPLSKNETTTSTTSSNTTTSSFSTPLKMIPPSDEENQTPKVMSTAIPMQTLMTPAHLYPHSINEEVEYSFEETRSGFVLPITTPLKKAVYV